MGKDIYQLFEVQIEKLQHIIQVALSSGGDYADIFFEYSTSNEIGLKDGEVNIAESNIDFGVGIRVVSKGKTGYAYCENTDIKDMEKAAKIAAQIANKHSYYQPVNINNLFPKNYYPIITPWEDKNIGDKQKYLTKINELVFQGDPRVNKVIARIADSNSKILFYNSLGDLYTDERPLVSMSVSCIMEENGKYENFSTSRSFRMGTEFLSDELISTLANEVINGCTHLFQADRPKGGDMQVVMGAGSSGILLHEAIGHAFEADFIRKGTSIFTDKLGDRICRKGINVIDDGTIQNNRGALNIDDEGVLGQKTYMVEDGILTSFLHDRISADFYKTSPTGNGRRESFRFTPIPRMRATYMENGYSSEEDLISSVKNGIYVNNFSNGQVQIGGGDFTFYVKTGFMIENGRLTKPIKDTNIIGNGPKALADILEVANNFKIDNGTWTCGKEQYCAVSCGMPSVLINKLNVGGII